MEQYTIRAPFDFAVLKEFAGRQGGWEGPATEEEGASYSIEEIDSLQARWKEELDEVLGKTTFLNMSVQANLRELEPSPNGYAREEWDGTYTVLLHLRKKEAS